MSDKLLMQLTEYATVIGSVIMLAAPRLAKLLKNGKADNGGLVVAVARELEECQNALAGRDELIKELKNVIAEQEGKLR